MAKLLHRFIVVALACAPFHTACKFGTTESDLRVTNGRQIGDDEMPAIVNIQAPIGGGAFAGCTATWVSDRTILTAAHCIVGDGGQLLSPVRVARGGGKGAVATRSILHPTYRRGTDGYDVAIVVFPPNSSTQFIPVSPTQARAGEELILVGFGKFDHNDGQSGGPKRTGRNRVLTIDQRGRIVFDGNVSPLTAAGTGEDVVNSQGDSGGPMLINGRIIGISSTVNTELTQAGKLRGNYESLRTPAVENWLRQQVAAAPSDIVIRGLDASDPLTDVPGGGAGGDGGSVAGVFVRLRDAAAGAPQDMIQMEFAAQTGTTSVVYCLDQGATPCTQNTVVPPTNATSSGQLQGRPRFTGELRPPAPVLGAAPLKLRVEARDAAGKVLSARALQLARKP